MGHSFKKIKVWEKAHKLVLEIYEVTRNFPHEERFGLINQLRRSASSVATSKKDFAHFLNLANSSLEETKYHILLSYDLRYLAKEDHERLSDLADEIGRMLFGFQKSLVT